MKPRTSIGILLVLVVTFSLVFISTPFVQFGAFNSVWARPYRYPTPTGHGFHGDPCDRLKEFESFKGICKFADNLEAGRYYKFLARTWNARCDQLLVYHMVPEDKFISAVHLHNQKLVQYPFTCSETGMKVLVTDVGMYFVVFFSDSHDTVRAPFVIHARPR